MKMFFLAILVFCSMSSFALPSKESNGVNTAPANAKIAISSGNVTIKHTQSPSVASSSISSLGSENVNDPSESSATPCPKETKPMPQSAPALGVGSNLSREAGQQRPSTALGAKGYVLTIDTDENSDREEIIEEKKEEIDGPNRFKATSRFLSSRKCKPVLDRVGEKLKNFAVEYRDDEKPYQNVDITRLSSRARVNLLGEIIRIKRETLRGIKGYWRISKIYDNKPTTLKIGKFSYKLEINPFKDQPGNGKLTIVNDDVMKIPGEKLPQLGTYVDIVQWIKDHQNHEGKLPAKYIDLLLIQRKYGDTINTGDEKESKFLNGLNLLLDFEEARRRVDGDAYVNLPIFVHIKYMIEQLNKWTDYDIKNSSKTLSLFAGKLRPDAEVYLANQDATDDDHASEAEIRCKLESSHKADEYSDEEYSGDKDSKCKRKLGRLEREKETFLKTVIVRRAQAVENGDYIILSNLRNPCSGKRILLFHLTMFINVFEAANEERLKEALDRLPKSYLRDEAEYLARRLPPLTDEIDEQLASDLSLLEIGCTSSISSSSSSNIGLFRSPALASTSSCSSSYGTASTSGESSDQEVDPVEAQEDYLSDDLASASSTSSSSKLSGESKNPKLFGKVLNMQKMVKEIKKFSEKYNAPSEIPINEHSTETAEQQLSMDITGFLNRVSDRYIEGMRNAQGEELLWGGDLELMLTAELLNLRTTVSQPTGSMVIGPINGMQGELSLTRGHYQVVKDVDGSPHEVEAKGNCLFQAQLILAGMQANDLTTVSHLRNAVADNIREIVAQAIENPIRLMFNAIVYAGDQEQLEDVLDNAPPGPLRDEAKRLARRQIELNLQRAHSPVMREMPNSNSTNNQAAEVQGVMVSPQLSNCMVVPYCPK